MLELLKSQIDSTVGVATAVIGLVVLVVTSFFKIFSLYDRHWSGRRHEILRELRATEKIEGPFARYLEEAIYLESYRIVSGVRANRLKAEFLIRLAAIGHWNNFQIRQIAKFIVTTPEIPTPKFRITAWEAAGARLSLFLGIFLMAMGFVLGVGVMLKGATLGAVFAGFGVEFAFILAAALVMSSYNTYKIARKFGEYVKEHPEIFTEKDRRPEQEYPNA